MRNKVVKFAWAAGIFAALYIFAVVASGLGLNLFWLEWDFTNTGQFGDSFGPLNAMIAGIAAVGAIGAYFAQSEELERVKGESATERRLATKRDFESTFFNLIALFRDTVNDIEVSDAYGQNPIKGRDAIGRILIDQIGETRGNDADDKANYEAVYARNRDDLGHYFRLLYQIVRFIDESEVENKSIYIRVLRATLSNTEMQLLGLNCVYGGGFPKFKKLVEKYALLHNISSSEAIARRLHVSLDQNAFGDRDLRADSMN